MLRGEYRGEYYRGRTVLITGASSGIGEAMAVQLAQAGARLILVARRRERLEALAARLSAGASTQPVVMPSDLSVPGSAQVLFDQLNARGLSPDVLINNAGFGEYIPFQAQQPEALAEVIHLNIEAPTVLARLCLPAMVARGFGGVLNVGSVVGFMPIPGFSVYSASKTYVMWWTQSLREELRGTGVNVSVLCPGPTTTEFHLRSETGGMGPSWTYSSPERVAAQALKALSRGKLMQITGVASFPQAWAAALLPRRLMTWISGVVMALAKKQADRQRKG